VTPIVAEVVDPEKKTTDGESATEAEYAYAINTFAPPEEIIGEVSETVSVTLLVTSTKAEILSVKSVGKLMLTLCFRRTMRFVGGGGAKIIAAWPERVTLTGDPLDGEVAVNVAVAESVICPLVNVSDEGVKLPDVAEGVIVRVVPGYCGALVRVNVTVTLWPIYIADGRPVTAICSSARTVMLRGGGRANSPVDCGISTNVAEMGPGLIAKMSNACCGAVALVKVLVFMIIALFPLTIVIIVRVRYAGGGRLSVTIPVAAIPT
jgi:hypothetical protein